MQVKQAVFRQDTNIARTQESDTNLETLEISAGRPTRTSNKMLHMGPESFLYEVYLWNPVGLDPLLTHLSLKNISIFHEVLNVVNELGVDILVVVHY